MSATSSATDATSWQVTSIRQGGFAKAHCIVEEVEKTREERRKYLYPFENGVSETLRNDYPRFLEIQKQQSEDAKNRELRARQESMHAQKLLRHSNSAGTKMSSR